MRLERKWLFRAGAALCFVVLGVGEASAQGFFQQLFGFGSPPAAEPPSSRAPAPLTPGGRPYTFPNQSFSPRRADDDDDDRSTKTGTLKTVCVRMCDGYYFPVSNATGKKGLFRDQMKCKSACGESARLFHMPVGSTDVGEATDGQGRVYGLLNVAYKYRKSLVPDCQCRPAPWSEVEMARHQQYADAETEKATTERLQATKVAAAGDDTAADAKKPTTAARSEDASSKPTKLAGNARSASNKTTSQSRRAQTTTVAQAPKAAPAGAMSLGGGGLQWPGDQRR